MSQARVALPKQVRACLFDMDGVLTQTATVHAAAWKETFDEYLLRHSASSGQPFVPFNPQLDYLSYVDGKKREDGVRSFLASRGIVLPEGSPTDPPDALTVHGLGNRKNSLLLKHLQKGEVEVYEGSVRFVHAARAAGLRCAVVSASANAEQVLASAGIADLFEARIDGVFAAREQLAGKPAPDMFLAGARVLNVTPAHAVVFEDALAGVQAGRAGGFALVVGVDRVGQAAELREQGADLVVTDLAELLELS